MELHPSVPGRLTIGTVLTVLKQLPELSLQGEPVDLLVPVTGLLL